MSENIVKKSRKSSTHQRRITIYPTPQNEARIDKFAKTRECSKNEIINDALSYYLVNVHHVRIGM